MFIDQPRDKQFAIASRILMFVWVIGIYAPLNLYWDHANDTDRIIELRFPNRDFSQYYIAGVAARYNLWHQLYPKFKPEWMNRPGRKIWNSDCAEASPEILKKISGLPNCYVENIAPPPQAIICMPLAYMPFHFAFKVWMAGLLLAILAIATYAVRIYRLFGGESGYFEGGLYIFAILIPLFPRIGGADNAELYLVLCISVAALSWFDRRSFTLATSLIIPAVFKGMTTSWCPLLFVKPVKYFTLAWMGIWTIFLNGFVLFLGGIEPYRYWFYEILPNAQSMEIQQYWHHTMNLKGIMYNWGWTSFSPTALTFLQLGGLLAVYLGFWQKRNDYGLIGLANIFAAIVAAIVLFNIFNRVSWLPYITFLYPFVGWASFEYIRSSFIAKRTLKICAFVLLLLIPFLHFVVSLIFHGSYGDGVRDVYFGLEVLFLIIAYRRLFGSSSFDTVKCFSTATKGRQD